MNDDIKEIIQYFKDDIDYLEEELKYPNFKGRYITIRDKECEYLRKLLDYITNLQKENKHLDEVNCHLRKKINNDDFDETMKDIKDNLIARINRQECEIHNLKEELQAYKKERENILDKSKRLNYKLRIDKAIELIEENLTFYITIGGTNERKLIGYNKAFDELLKILKGSEKE